jgi:hypothetical protein
MGLSRNYAIRVASLRNLIAVYDDEIAELERDIHRHLRHDRGYVAVQAINGVGRTIAAILVTEIGDISRFPSPGHLCSWAGLTPGHRGTTSGEHRPPGPDGRGPRSIHSKNVGCRGSSQQVDWPTRCARPSCPATPCRKGSAR